MEDNKTMVYKYYAPTDYNMDALKKQYFWFSKAKYLNDPYDVCADVIELFPDFKGVLGKLYNNDIESYYQKVQNFAICCFTTNCINKHMWALYADSYKGWCLEFEEEQIIDTATTGVPSKFVEVHYIDEYPDFNNPNLQLDISTRGGSSKLNDFIKDARDADLLFAYILSLKERKIWEHEDEKRLFLGNIYYTLYPNAMSNNDIGYQINWSSGKLKSIIMGSNISEENKVFLDEQASKKKVLLKQITPIVPSTDFNIKVELIKDYSRNV